MKNIKQITLTLVAIITLTFNIFGQSKSTVAPNPYNIEFNNQERTDFIIDKYDPYLKALDLGVSVLVVKDKKMTVSSSGNYDLNENSVFNIGSATKKFTAILLLQEVEKGNIKLSDKISQYLSPIKNVDGNLTIETLLRHRSGLGELVGRNIEQLFFEKSDSIYQTNFLDKIPVGDSELIGKYDYCNTNYFLLGYILEKVTDQSYFDLVKERIFIPCEMTHSYPYISKSIQNLAHPTYHGQDVYENIDHRFFANLAFAAGSIASTLPDIAKFYEHTFEKYTLINQQSIQKMINFDDADYGLGMTKISLDGTDYIGHGGNNIGYAFREYYNTETKNLVLIFSNSMSIPFPKLLRNEFLDFSNDKRNNLKFNKNTADEFKSTIGTYFFKEMDMELSIVSDNNVLSLNMQGMNLPLVNHAGKKLNTAMFGIEFEINPDNVDELIFRQGGNEAVIKRVK